VIKRASPIFSFKFSYLSGAAGGIRTPDPRITNAMLYQLSYCGFFTGKLAAGVQPARWNMTLGACGFKLSRDRGP
jgi:hypothetical protein